MSQIIYFYNLLFLVDITFKSILSEMLSNMLLGSDVLLFSEFINIVSILFYNFIELILLYTFLVIYFARYKEYITCLTSFLMFSDVLSAFICARVIGNLWSICLGVNILVLYVFVGYWHWEFF